jgi:superfamily II DNA or RNA helicase
MKTTISKRGFSIYKDALTSSEIIDLKKDLTVKPFINGDYGVAPKPFPTFCESIKKLYIPRFYGQHKYGLPSESKLNDPKSINIDFSKSLKDKQKPIVETYLKAAEEVGGGIISVPCGYGKTVIALYIAAALKVKTLVVVHKEFLLNQWKERIREFIPNAKIGRLQSNVIHVEGYDIVIGMLQSISMIDYSDKIFEEFGLVIYDECHHLGAETFSKALLKTGTKYTLGLSATPKRADGLSKVFEWYLGEIVYSIKKRDEDDVNVKMVIYKNSDSKYSKEVLNFKKKPNMATMINNICEFLPRTIKIIEHLTDCLREGRKILMLSDRREHLKVLHDLIGKIDDGKYSSGFYLGGMKEKDLQETETKDVILGTFMMASEGFDCKYPLDTIFLTSPKSNIEQAVGRILRQEAKDRKFTPLIYDIADDFSLFAKQKLKRVAFYNKNTYKIKFYDNDNKEIEVDIPGSKKGGGGRKNKLKVEDMEFMD